MALADSELRVVKGYLNSVKPKVPKPALEALGCRELACTAKGRVWIRVEATKEFDGLDDTKKSRLIRTMELWCDNQRLTPEQFNGNEGREQKGNTNVLIQAFKTHKNRLYGSVLQIESQRTFVVVEVDPAKKQDKADPTILKRAKGRSFDLVGEVAKLSKNAVIAGRKK